MVTEDELDDPGKLRFTAVLEGPSADGTQCVTLQSGTTADLIFPVEQIISDLSRVVTLCPGDVIFTGTPAGVGGPRGLSLKPGARGRGERDMAENYAARAGAHVATRGPT